MITVTEIIGTASDPRFADKLHQLEHQGRVENLTIDSRETPRHRIRGRTDKGTEVAIALDRGQRLANGVILLLNDERAILVRTTEQRWLRLAPRDLDAAVALGYFIGNLHWRVRFQPAVIAVAVEGPEDDYRARLAAFLASNQARIVPDV